QEDAVPESQIFSNKPARRLVVGVRFGDCKPCRGSAQRRSAREQLRTKCLRSANELFVEQAAYLGRGLYASERRERSRERAVGAVVINLVRIRSTLPVRQRPEAHLVRRYDFVVVAIQVIEAGNARRCQP